MKDEIVPCFTSHYSLPDGILTLEAKGKTKVGGPNSIVDLCVDNNIKDCVLIESTLGGAFEASRNLSNAGVNLFFGYKVIVCADETDKSDASRDTESKVIIFPKNDDGWHQLIKIANRANTEGFYYKPRTSWKQLNQLWNDSLMLSLPFFSSFIVKNTLTLNHVVPDLPAIPTLMIERGSGLPFEPILESAAMQFNASNPCAIQNVKTIYYKNKSDFETYISYRAKLNRNTFDKPNLDHMASDQFCIESYKELTK